LAEKKADVEGGWTARVVNGGETRRMEWRLKAVLVPIDRKYCEFFTFQATIFF